MYNPIQAIAEDLLYPSEDGKPMATNPEHFNTYPTNATNNASTNAYV
ncbi:hypothetical protein [Pseudanabaena sp. PCC 6802]|nr:hypothetical protein [Pseudanabaena sp. PCC 6802]